MTRRLLPLLTLIVLVAALAFGLRLNQGIVPSPLIGKPAPEFLLPKLDEPAARVAPADLYGQVWLLNVWASWCSPCLAEHPILSALKRDKVTIVGMNYKDRSSDALAWLQREGNPFLFSLRDAKGAAAIEWGVYGVPETFVIDQKGIIRHKHIGPLRPSDVRESLGPLLAKLAAESP